MALEYGDPTITIIALIGSMASAIMAVVFTKIAITEWHNGDKVCLPISICIAVGLFIVTILFTAMTGWGEYL